jgi:hypothetical protein
MKPLPALLALIALALAGCETTKPLYYWGNYESGLYLGYKHPEKATPEQIAKHLEEDLAQAAARSLPPPPGMHAHLGFTYLELGRADEAKQQFETEKKLYPESTVFMDRILAKLTGGTAK